MTRKEAKLPDITLGETLCERLKAIYYPNVVWIDCYGLVAKKFTLIKVIAKTFYPDANANELLRHLIKFSDSDVQDMLDNH